jgi:hypothetical protein
MQHFTANAFGDPFDVHALPLPRPADGYAVQMLDTDTLLDRRSGSFLPVRSPKLEALFDTFESAREAAANWVSANCHAPDEHHLSIVPASFDPQLERHILIYGVLCGRP